MNYSIEEYTTRTALVPPSASCFSYQISMTQTLLREPDTWIQSKVWPSKTGKALSDGFGYKQVIN